MDGFNGAGKLQRAGRDYQNEEFCLLCWDGGDLMLCDGCPTAFHAECLGYSPVRTLPS